MSTRLLCHPTLVTNHTRQLPQHRTSPSITGRQPAPMLCCILCTLQGGPLSPPAPQPGWAFQAANTSWQ